MKHLPPAVALLVLEPFLGEVRSTATPITAFVLPWTFLFEAALYGDYSRVWGTSCSRRSSSPRSTSP